MKVLLGLALDSRQGPMERDFVNEIIVGPLGLVGLLETHLGLSGPAIAQAQRVAEYLGCLRACDSANRFYSASLKTDDLGTAAELLGWRDSLRMWGWEGVFASMADGRLKDLADVEHVARDQLSAGQAERIDAIRSRLKTRKVPIEEIQLFESISQFPKHLRELIELLPFVEPVAFAPTHSGRLGEVQRELTRMVVQQVPPNQLTTPVDDSIIVVQSNVVEVAERWLAALCHAEPRSRLILCEDGGPSLDDAVRSTGHPTCGFNESSTFRPALQVLPLFLENLWSPLNVQPLIELLMHRLGPIPRQATSLLAKALVKQPGLGGTAWKEAKAEIAKFERGAEILSEVSFWIESQRWDRHSGAPLSAVIERTERIHEYFRSQLGSSNHTQELVAQSGLGQVSSFQTSLLELSAQGQQLLDARQIDRLVELATTGGARNPLATAEAACWQSATSAAACTFGVDEVIWWMPASPVFPKAHPWSPFEVEALTANGIEVPDAIDSVAQLFMSWLRPLHAAQTRFTMVLPPPDREEHPIWQLLRQIDPSLHPISLESELHGGRLEDFSIAVNHQPLSAIRSQWDLSPPLTPSIERYSYSSLVELFGNPAVTVLKRTAKFWPMQTKEAESEERLLGTLAHRLVEELLNKPGALNWDSVQLNAWHQTVFPGLIEREGVTLLAAGAKAKLQRFSQQSLLALNSLLRHLQEAQAVGVEVEKVLIGQLGSFELVGTLDLIVELPDNRRAILDLKWSGGKLAESLRQGRFLQLALYARLLKDRDRHWPATVGYFVFRSGEMFTISGSVFPNARVCLPADGQTYDDLLAMTIRTLAWRLEQLSSGTLAVVDERLGLNDEFQGPDGTWPIVPSNRSSGAFLPLFGWELT